MVTWTARVQETFSKCKRRVNVEFPTEARGWIVLYNSALSEDQRAIVAAKTQGKLDFETVIGSMRSCFPEFRAPTKTARSRGASVYVAQHEEADSGEPLETTSIGEDEGPDAVQFQELESFLAEHGRAFQLDL